MGVYRCYHEDCAPEPGGRLGFDFTADDDAPVCPQCHTDARLPEYRALVVPVAVHHYLHRHPSGAVTSAQGRFALACDPARPLGHDVHATREVTVVNCPACKATDAYALALKLSRRRVPGVHPEGDREVRFDPANPGSHPAPSVP